MSEYDDNDDFGERTVSELEEVHSPLGEILSTLKSRTDFSGWIWFAVILLLLTGWSGSNLDKWTDRVWYSFRYDTDFKNVIVDKRPMDCDFLHAPLGAKGCITTSIPTSSAMSSVERSSNRQQPRKNSGCTQNSQTQ